jgi:hypothetical protein
MYRLGLTATAPSIHRLGPAVNVSAVLFGNGSGRKYHLPGQCIWIGMRPCRFRPAIEARRRCPAGVTADLHRGGHRPQHVIPKRGIIGLAMKCGLNRFVYPCSEPAPARFSFSNLEKTTPPPTWTSGLQLGGSKGFPTPRIHLDCGPHGRLLQTRVRRSRMNRAAPVQAGFHLASEPGENRDFRAHPGRRDHWPNGPQAE